MDPDFLFWPHNILHQNHLNFSKALASQRNKYIRIIAIILVWVTWSWDPRENPEALSACFPPAGEHQGRHVGTQPYSGGYHLKDGKGPSGTNSAIGIFFVSLPMFSFLEQRP